MYDKTIRRRRAVLLLLVVGSLILITASFGGSSGPVGSIQRGLGTVISPIQEGTSRALGPVRDLFGWFGDTWSAKKELSKARKDRDRWQEQATSLMAEQRKAKEYAGLLKLRDTPYNVGQYGPVAARVVGRPSTVWSNQVTIDQGTSAGIKVGQPVVASDTGGGAGLVGKVTTAAGGWAVVTLLTNGSFSVTSKSVDGRTTGDLQPRGGNPQDLVLRSAKLADSAEVGTVVVTAGTISKRKELASVYPQDIPIGRISRIDDPSSETELAHVRPFVDLREINYVQVLTAAGGPDPE